ncbi:MAG: radical SAM protein [Christensenellales bacterium]
MKCNYCPRKCNIDRSVGVGICGVSFSPKLAKVYLHQWEEPCICYDKGSGTIFFSGCNLKCVYCQNYQISSEGYGKYITIERLAEIFKELEDKGACNINLVSPSHYALAIRDALKIYRPDIPIVYNSSGYDSLESLEILKDYVDIYLVDFKYYDSELAGRLSRAKDYPSVAKSMILKMREYQPREIYDENKLKKGMIVRHLILPNHTDDSINILKWIKENINNPLISLMGQYTPMYRANEFSDINRKLKPIEYKIVYKAMLDLGLTNGYTQELDSANESYTPIWDLSGV